MVLKEKTYLEEESRRYPLPHSREWLPENERPLEPLLDLVSCLCLGIYEEQLSVAA